MCSSVQPVCSYTHVDFRIWNLVVVALKSVSFARLKVTAFVWSVGSPWSRWSNPRSAQMWSRLAPFTQQRVNIRGVDSVGSCVRAFTHNSPTAITQAPEAKETLAAAGERLWQQVAAKKPPRTWNLLFLQVQTHTDKDQEDQDRDQAGVLWLWGQRGGRRRGGSGRWRAGEEQLQDQVLWLWRPERERQWRWELSAEREKGQESSCSTGLSQLQRGQPSYQRLSGQPSQQQHWSVVLVNMQNLCSLAYTDALWAVYNLISPQMLLTFLMNPVLEPPRDIKDAQENQVISPKTLALALKRSSVDLKRYWSVSLSVYSAVMK